MKLEVLRAESDQPICLELAHLLEVDAGASLRIGEPASIAVPDLVQGGRNFLRPTWQDLPVKVVKVDVFSTHHDGGPYR
eukprot:s594_g20.t1